MSKCKRNISVLLAMLIALGSLTGAAFAAQEAPISQSLPFTNVASEDWFFEAVQYVH